MTDVEGRTQQKTVAQTITTPLGLCCAKEQAIKETAGRHLLSITRWLAGPKLLQSIVPETVLATGKEFDSRRWHGSEPFPFHTRRGPRHQGGAGTGDVAMLTKDGKTILLIPPPAFLVPGLVVTDIHNAVLRFEDQTGWCK
jgi:hypothetical protein